MGILSALKRAAADGSASAPFILGRLYDEGWGVKADSRIAFRWYKRAAQAGSPEALYFVASAYASGEGVRRDPRRGFQWFKKAAAAGDATGAYMVAVCVFDGTGCRKDAARGLRMLLQLARRGSSDAMDFLAAHYIRQGRLGVAKRWAMRAIRRGHEIAPLRLREIERLRKERRGR